MQQLPITAKLTALPGVGAKRMELLSAAGFHTIEDLLWGLPYRYIDRGSILQVAKAKQHLWEPETDPNQIVTLLGKIIDLRQITTRIKRMQLTEALLDDGTDTIRLIWFNQPHLPKIIKSGDTLLVWGSLTKSRNGTEMHSPAWECIASAKDDSSEQTQNNPAQKVKPPRYLSLYRRITALTGKTRQKLIELALRHVDNSESFLPLELTKNLPDTITALNLLHNPPDDCNPDDLETRSTPAHQRLATEELFAFALGVELRRTGRLERQGEKVPTSPQLREKLKTYLPFSLTPPQRTAFREIVQDLTSGRVMHRMLQGDVGSGKTLVAFLTMAMVAETGGQAALLAPTEVLARQHAAVFAKLLKDNNDQIQLLVGAMKVAEKRQAMERIANGQASYIVGTHSLFQEAVAFNKLQLVVVDEQHRFGVKQRESMKEKGIDPHWLVMSATPIPRSLALALFGDLDQSVLDALPPGRQPVKTYLLPPNDAEKAWDKVEREITEGRQAFIISPAIDTSDTAEPKISLRDIQTMEALLRSRFPNIPIAIVHGRLKADELNQRMTEFQTGKASILLATTVVEVGVDIPNATIMVVDHAERFGLGQLHQLRGRVGRGQYSGKFIMISKSETERLQVLTQITDGFRIAQKDLEIRGPGEFFGTRQSGLPQFQVADLIRDRQLLIQCKDAASNAIKRGLTNAQKAWLQQEQKRLKLAEIS